MTCGEATELLSGYHDGQLAGGQAESVAAHLACCPGCRGTLDRLRRADAALAASADRLAGGANIGRLAQGVAGRIDRPTPARRGRRRWALSGWAAAAAAILLAALAWPMLRPSAPPLAGVAGYLDQDLLVSRFPPPGHVGAEQPARPPAVSLSWPTGVAGPEPRPAGAGPAEESPVGQPERLTPGRAGLLAASVGPPAGERAEPDHALDFRLSAPPSAYAQLLRQVEVVLTRAAALAPDSPQTWSELGELVRRDDLVGRVRRTRQQLPADSQLAEVLASAEVMLIRTELAGAGADRPAELQQAILASHILDRCRTLRT